MDWKQKQINNLIFHHYEEMIKIQEKQGRPFTQKEIEDLAAEGVPSSDGIAPRREMYPGLRENIHLKGKVRLEHSREGKKILEKEILNIVTDAGLALISGLLISDVAVNDCDEIAIGIGAIGGTADSGTTTTTVDAERTEADDYWNGATITYVTGSNAGETQSITDFVASSDTITHGAFSNAVSAGDQYKLSALPASTALESEITTGGGERRTGANITGTRETTTVTDDTTQLVTTFTFTAAFAVNECGVFNDPSAGDMPCATVFGDVNVISGDTLAFTWQIIFSKG